MNRETEAPIANLVRVDVHDLTSAEPPSAEYVVDGLIPVAVVLLGGHGGAGKSILALIIAAHVAAGVPFAGRRVRRGRVVFASLEDPSSVVRWRLHKIVQAYGLDPHAVAAFLVILDGSGGDATLAAERLDAGARWIVPTATMAELREAAGGAVLVIIDNASDAFDGNENDRRQVRAFLRLLAGLGREVGAAMLLLAHIDKAAARSGPAGNSYSGSTAWHNSARARFALGKDSGAIVLAMEKNNLGPIAAPLTFRWNDHGVLVPTTAAELVTAISNDPNIAADNGDVLACLRAATCDVPTATMGAFTAFHALKHRPDMPSWALKGADGKARFARALVRLERVGRIRRQEYQTRHRHRSERWVVAEERGQ
ncbi:AAA family ATPase [Lysobacter sp. 2RAF19]